MATVYLAIQENFQREVALKIMSPALSQDESFSERFLREARIVSRLVHPHIVTVHDVGIQNGHHYLSMEYIEGQDLKERLPSLNSEQLFRIAKEIARALDYAGRKGYVHRDVKPENIMIHNLDGRAVLMDFGIARAADSASTMTRTGTALGTPHYMSPEQARGDPIDSRSDLYSLGVLLYYMLVGRVPYEAESPVAVGIKHVSAPIPKLPSELSSYQFLIDKLMAKQPDDRYQTGSDVVEALSSTDTVFLDLWRPTQGFEYLGSHEHTPLRSDQVKLVGSISSNANVVVAGDTPGTEENSQSQHSVRNRRQPLEPTVAQKAGPQPQEMLHIPKEDLDERARLKAPSQWLYALPTVILLLVGGGYYIYSKQLNQPEPVANSESVLGQSSRAGAETGAETSVEKKTEATPESITAGQSASAANTNPVVKSESAAASLESTGSVKADRPTERATENKSQVTAEKPVAISSEAGADDLPEKPVAELLQQAGKLEQQVKQDPANTPALMALYNQILILQPDNEQVLAAVEKLKSDALNLAAIQIDVGQLDEASASLEKAVSWFPDLQESANYQQLLKRIDRTQTIADLLGQAKRYVMRDRLIRPEGANARELYDQVLALDPNNVEAINGVENIVRRYETLAQSEREQYKFNQAMEFVESGLSVKYDDAALLNLQGQLAVEQEEERQVQQALAEAEQLAREKNWFGEDNSAVKRYRSILIMQPGRKQALDGLNDISKAVVSEVEQMIAAKDYKTAQQLIESARASLPDSPGVQRLIEQLDALGPMVSDVLLSGREITDLSVEPSTRISADRTLYITFRYGRLEQPATVLQAVLFDGARSGEIAAVPVVVTGEEGDAKLTISRPVEGFTEGGYHLDILLGSERIFTTPFVIDN